MLVSPKKPMFLFCVLVCISIKIFIFKTGISRNHYNCYCQSESHSIGLFMSPWTAACQAPLSMEFSRPEY